MIKIKHQSQPTNNTCVSACIAMLTDQDVSDVVNEFHERYWNAGGSAYGNKEIYKYLNARGIKLRGATCFDVMDGKLASTYLINAPSLNYDGESHQLIYQIEVNDFLAIHYLYDPAMGIENKNYYVTAYDETDDPLAVKLKSFSIDFILDEIQVTPAAHFHVAGEKDWHAGKYDAERAQLALGNYTDDELANGAFMNYDRPLDIIMAASGDKDYHSPIAWMTAVKDRIRWLSRALVRSEDMNRKLREMISEKDELLRLAIAQREKGPGEC